MDYYIQASVQVPMSRAQADALLELARHAVCAETEKLLDLPVGVPGLLQQLLVDSAGDEEEPYSRVEAGFGTSRLDLDGLTLLARPEGLWLLDSERADLDKMAALIQAAILLYDLPPVGFEYACTGSRPAADAYGGGVVFVTKDAVLRQDTSEMLARMRKRPTLKRALEQGSAT